ncbi:MAG: hypothetical protein ACUVX1_16750 [Chloroflexota bacterium]
MRPMGGITQNATSLIKRRNLAAILGVCASVVLAVAVRVAFGPHLRDDAYITLRYAERIAAGQGFVFNPGEHVLGTTTPLFALLLAGLARLGLPVEDSAVAIGIGCDAIAVVVLSAIGARFLQGRGIVFTALCYALFSPLVSHAVSGMETPLYTLLILSSVLVYSVGRMASAGVLVGLVILARPDGLLLALVLFVHALVFTRSGLWRASAAAAATVAPWIVFSTAYFGSPLPQSVVAKAQSMPQDALSSFGNFLWYFSDDAHRRFLPLVPVFFLGIARRQWDRSLVVLMAWAGLYSLAFIASGKFVFPEWPFEWYFVPLMAPFALGVGAGLERVVGLLTPRSAKAALWRRTVALTVALIFIASYSWVLNYNKEEWTKWVGGREALYAHLAQAMIANGVEDEVVAAYEIGAFGFHYPGPILDLWGLVSPQVSFKDAAETLYATRPPWIMSYTEMMPPEVVSSPWFQTEYREFHVEGNWEGRRATLYRRYPPAEEVNRPSTEAVVGRAMRLVRLEVAVKPLPNNRSVIHTTMVWQALRKMDGRLTVSVQLHGTDGQKLGQHDAEPQAGQYPTTLWHPGEMVTDKHDLIVDSADLADDPDLVLAAYRAGAPQSLEPWSDRTGADLGTALHIPLASVAEWEGSGSPLLQAGPLPPPITDPADPCVLGDGLQLIGMEAKVRQLQDSRKGLRVTLVWKALRELDRQYTVFVHLLDADGNLRAQHDSQPRNNRYPTTLWQVGETVLDVHELEVDTRESSAEPSLVVIGAYQTGSVDRLLHWSRPTVSDWPHELRVPLSLFDVQR